MEQHTDPGLRWVPLLNEEIHARLEAILRSWEGTPYRAGQQVRGVGVDCVRFGTAVLDELYRRPAATSCPNLPHDISLHNPIGARTGLRFFLERYPDHRAITNREVEPGDIVVTGPARGGPGHIMIVGTRPSTVWQAVTGAGVHYTGFSFMASVQTVFAIYRLDKTSWK